MTAKRRQPGAGLAGLPDVVRLMTQRIDVATAVNLHHGPTPGEWVHEEGAAEPHGHRAYGVYDEAQQVITLDDSLGFERARETFLHENIHALFAISQLDGVIDGQSEGLSEHIVAAVAPVMLSWMRDNPEVMEYLTEVQP